MLARSPAFAPKIDGRLAPAKRAKTLVAQWVEQLGIETADAAMLARLRRAAELVVVAEVARANALRGTGDAGLDNLVRLERLAEIAVRRLGIDRQKREPDTLALLNGDRHG